MIRRALVLLAVISLLMCAFCVTLGVRSVWKHDRIQVRVAGRPYALNSRAGGMSFWGGSDNESEFSPGWFTFEGDVYSLQPWESDGPGPVSSKWDAAGFGYVRGWYPRYWSSAGKARYHMLIVPAWAAAILTALLPAWAFPRQWRGWRGRRRTARGQCYVCGYDVRNSPDRCPECGTPTLQAARGLTRRNPPVTSPHPPAR
jgi:hypothetical protein